MLPRVVMIAAVCGLTAVTAGLPGPTAAAPNQPAGQTLKSGTYELVLPLGLEADAAYVPDTNPLSNEKIALGKLLYFDARLSNDNSISCASCHNPAHGFADTTPTSKGVGGKLGGRNSPTVINRLFSDKQFWDGRAADLEDQAKGPMINPVEMGMATHDVVVAHVRGVPGYAPLFEKAFGSAEVTIERVTQAIASYERTVVSGNSAFDRYMAGDKKAMKPAALRGMNLFNGKANCKTCHAAFNFTDESYHNLGVGMDKPKVDVGRYDQTKQDADKGAFKTPTLRNVAQTGPYMHDGSEKTLTKVIELYNKGGTPNPWLSKEIKPLHLTPTEVADLVAFMNALTGEVQNAKVPASLPH